MKHNPYQDMPSKAFWSTAVAAASPFSMSDLYQKKWEIPPRFKIATAGSCFAQHISRWLRKNHYNVLDLEPPPQGLPVSAHNDFGFSMYSCRYGNIYTVQQLRQLAQEAAGISKPADPVWEKDGRFYDALRPSVEPEGLLTPEEVILHRTHHLARVRKMFLDMDLFIFTLGLTEAWVHLESGTVYPTCPGTIAGSYDSNVYGFKNFGFVEILRAFNEFQEIVRELRGGKPFKILVTVSPVPLTATASGKHILQATTYSKAVLRAVAGQLSENQRHVDYFPSYEIVTNQAARGMFYEPNMRSVRPEGVEAVMKVFFSVHTPLVGKGGPANSPASSSGEQSDVQCEEAMLEAFNK